MKKINFYYNDSIKNAENRIYKETVLNTIKFCSFTCEINGITNDAGKINIGNSSDKYYINSRINAVGKSFLSICDLYSLDFLKKFSNIFDGYLVPTAFHQKVLQSITSKPVYILLETIDPIYKKEVINSNSKARDLSWFGYSESFNKSMSHLIEVIDRVLDVSGGDFNIISDCNSPNFNKIDRAKFIKFEESTIATKLNSSKITILSHVPLDLKINTYIKSPNKLYSSIAAGALPLCSNTPAYEVEMKKLGLSEFIYKDSLQLEAVFSKLISIDLDEIIKNAQIKLYEIDGLNMMANVEMLKILSCGSMVKKDNLDSISIESLTQSFSIKAQFYQLLQSIFNKIR